MPFNFKIFALSFLLGATILGGGLALMLKFHSDADPLAQNKSSKNGFLNFMDTKATFSEEDRKSLSKMTEKSHRINTVLMGNDGGRTDTIMMASYDPDTKLIDLVSIPRDTYYKMQGFKCRRINAVYGLPDEHGGPDGTRKALSDLLDIPIHYYVSVDYEATKDVVNALGGIEVDVPFDMRYDDPMCKPPLHINLKAGRQVLDGDKAIQYLRWRHNNNGSGGAEGDLGRIKRQHVFAKLAIKKAVGPRLPLLIPTAFKYVKTDMPLGDMLKIGSSSMGMEMEKVQSYQIPGVAKTPSKASYFFHSPEDTEKMMLAIYNRTGLETATGETITKAEDLKIPPVQGN